MIPGLFFSSNLGEKVKRKAQGTGNTRVRHANEPRVSPIVSSATRITALRFSHDSAFIWKRIEKQREASKSEWVLLMGRIFENRLDRETYSLNSSCLDEESYDKLRSLGIARRGGGKKTRGNGRRKFASPRRGVREKR